MPRVSIVVTTYDSESFIAPCLESIRQIDWPDLEVIVVDNASKDATVENARASGGYDILIANETNRGCGGGNNDGWRASSGAIVLFLNPDTTVDPGIARALVEIFEGRPRAVVCGCKIFYPDGKTLWHAGAFLHPNAMTGHYGYGEEDRGQFDEVRAIDYASGCAIAIRRGFLEEVGGFNEDYWPGYYEEVDLCRTASRKGYEVLYVPRAIVFHHESQSFKLFSRSFYHYFYRNRVRFMINHNSPGEWLRRFLPFEYRWMRHIPESRGFRLRQFRYYASGLWYWFGRFFPPQRGTKKRKTKT